MASNAAQDLGLFVFNVCKLLVHIRKATADLHLVISAQLFKSHHSCILGLPIGEREVVEVGVEGLGADAPGAGGSVSIP
jgi:hypothetical protein